MIHQVYYKQRYPVKRTLLGWRYGKKKYVVPQRNSRDDEQGRLLLRTTSKICFCMIYNPNKEPFKRNVQRPMSEIKYTGVSLSEREFENKCGVKVDDLKREWE